MCTDIHTHSQQLELLQQKVLDLSKCNAIDKLLRDNKELLIEDKLVEQSKSSTQTEAPLTQIEQESSSQTEAQTPLTQIEQESSTQTEAPLTQIEQESSSQTEAQTLSTQIEPNILLNLKYKVLKPSAK